jgi:hypothetical protein
MIKNEKYETFIRISRIENNIEILKKWHVQNKINEIKYKKALNSLNKDLRKYKLLKLYE